MGRLPITLRLTLVFAAVTAAILGATGLYLHARLAGELDRAVRESLRSRADDVASLLHQARTPSRGEAGARLTEAGESFFQVVDARGAVVSGTRAIGRRRLLSRGELRRARRGTIITDRAALPRWDEGYLRLLATPVVTGRGERVVVVVGTSMEDQNDALQSHAHQLLVGGPVALLLATLTAFGLARAALRPVEALRRRAAEISAAQPDRRLPLPNTRDELFRLAETLNGMLARLQAALSRERAFVADAGHELRTPLTILKTELQLATRHDHTEEELRDAIVSAAEETDRLQTIAEHLLVMAASDRPLSSGRREVIDVAEVTDRVLGRFLAQAEGEGRALGSRVAPGTLVVAERLALDRAIANLVDNALRHGEGDVTVRATADGDVVELHVVDRGPGFPGHFLEHAFERFSRADPARGRGGSGLGLAIVRSIAIAHGGGAGAGQRPGGGADVWFQMQLAVGGPPDGTPVGAGSLAPSSTGN
jgi:two-component system OmpR family sensor kinase